MGAAGEFGLILKMVLCGHRCWGFHPLTPTLWQMTYYSCPGIYQEAWCGYFQAFSCKEQSGPSGIRTHDLLNAIETRSQLRYGPLFTYGGGILPLVDPTVNQWTWRDSNPRPHQCD
jgi:hypothetical protein